MLWIYNIILYTLFLLGWPIWLPLILITSKWRKPLWRRLTFIRPVSASQSIIFRNKKPIWIHALSVGEVISAIPLVSALRTTFPDQAIIFSASTQSGYTVAQSKLMDQVDTLFYFPFDLKFAIKRILRFVHPRLFILIETDVWPNLLNLLHRYQIPALWMNVRISTYTAKRYQSLRQWMRPLLMRFNRINVQTDLDAQRLMQTGLPSSNVCVAGNFKFDQELPPKEEVDQVQQIIGPWHASRRIILAGSTHRGEEGAVLKAFAEIKQTFDNVGLILAPRHPHRIEAIQPQASNNNLHAILYSALLIDPNKCEADVVIIDELGILGALYNFADIAFVGGSLVQYGGHNPLEPAALSKPILFGPDMSDFKEIATILLEARGALQVMNIKDLTQALSKLLGNDREARQMGINAHRVFLQHRGAVRNAIHEIKQWIPSD
jgi:3-deoxy-D-manno-octulosonic-acid transferase